jgi:polyhydroxybutyrate depolymerase
MTGFAALAEEAGFALAIPAALGEIWTDGRNASGRGEYPNDIGYLTAVIDASIARLHIDPARIYVVGMSNGAAMAGRLACAIADRIAGLAQVAGTAGVTVGTGYRPSRPVPVLNIHGTVDKIAPYEGGYRRGLRARIVMRRASEPAIGVEDWARFWVAANGASPTATINQIPPDTTVRTWRGQSPSSDVVFYRVEGAGHTWPGSRVPLPAFIFGRTCRTFDATRVIWEFLAAHTR